MSEQVLDQLDAGLANLLREVRQMRKDLEKVGEGRGAKNEKQSDC